MSQAVLTFYGVILGAAIGGAVAPRLPLEPLGRLRGPPRPPSSPIRCEVLRAQVLMHMQLQGEGDFPSTLD
jgi:hypothetical protein